VGIEHGPGLCLDNHGLWRAAIARGLREVSPKSQNVGKYITNPIFFSRSFLQLPAPHPTHVNRCIDRRAEEEKP